MKAEYRDGKLNQEWNGRKNIVIDGGENRRYIVFRAVNVLKVETAKEENEDDVVITQYIFNRVVSVQPAETRLG